MLDMVVHTFDSSTPEAKAVGLPVSSQLSYIGRPCLEQNRLQKGGEMGI
jgi:hypothetical protein